MKLSFGNYFELGACANVDDENLVTTKRRNCITAPAHQPRLWSSGMVSKRIAHAGIRGPDDIYKHQRRQTLGTYVLGK